MNKALTNRLRAHNEVQIRLAGPRYSPGVDPSAPNIQMRSLLLAVGCLAFDDTMRGEITQLHSALGRVLQDSPQWLTDAFSTGRQSPAFLQELLRVATDANPANVNTLFGDLSRTVVLVMRSLEHIRSRLYAEQHTTATEEARRHIQSKVSDVTRLIAAVRDVEELCASPAGHLLTNRYFFLVGDWGTGKTHFLCDVVRHRDAAGLPSLFVLGQHLPPGADPLQSICDTTEFATTPAALLAKLNTLGKTKNCRALFIVDGINEGDRRQWRWAMRRVQELTNGSTHIGVILSCRRPYDEDVATSRTRRRWIRIEHHGFQDVEFDAQLEFFTYYGVPAPQTPLLTPEFSRPLFLKVMCESIQALGKNAKRAYLRDLASGQKGMTRVLEDFARRIGSPIEDDFGLPRRTCWRLLKGGLITGQRRGVAAVMAAELREYLSVDECVAEIGQITGLSSRKTRLALLRRLVADGLLVTGLQWNRDGEAMEVVRLPYQRFSDHIVARHLLDRFLVTISEQTIRRSLYKNRPLGQVFALDQWGHRFAKPGLASAIMLEFPERVKRTLPADRRELIFLLPKDRRVPGALKDVFLEGLAWRSTDSFGPQADFLISFYLTKYGSAARDAVLDTLVGLGTRPTHPYAATRLWRYLTSMTMPERDLFWSQYLRTCEDSSVVFKLIEWIERTKARQTTDETARCCMVLLALFCTTTRRPLRDRATRAMVLAGEQHPNILADVAIESLSFNDPYVAERTVAACYGVAMRNWARRDRLAIRAMLVQLAPKLIKLQFIPGAPHATRHVLRRDFALGVIELAERLDPSVVTAELRQYITPPFRQLPRPFPPPSRVSEERAELAKSALRMDFENYTIGRLVEGRGNYQYDHPEYKAVRRQILWRIWDLGYRAVLFEEADSAIERASSYGRGDDPDRTTRYGKKYSWIAFFEMYGSRLDRKQLSDWRTAERTSDVDIDPSFPGEARWWQPPLPELFNAYSRDPREWIQNGPTPDYRRLISADTIDGEHGPWVLLDGYIEQAATDERRVFTFLRGLLTKEREAQRLVTTFLGVEYPGNNAIPEAREDHYTFGGEIPWSRRYAPSLRTESGNIRRDQRCAFGEWNRPNSGVMVEIPVCGFGWESYHSSLNQSRGIICLAPALATALNLVNYGEEWDLFDVAGNRATLLRQFKGANDTFSSRLLYIRRDLLMWYLKRTRQAFVLMSWGEREFKHERSAMVRADIADLLQRHADIHRCAYLFSGS